MTQTTENPNPPPESQTTLGVCVIGCGARGAKHAAWWNERPDARVLSVFDPDETRCRETAENVGARAFGDAIEAMEAEGVHVVSVCSPVSFHREHTVAAAERGLHILAEKALALTLEDGEKMIEAAERNNVMMAVHLQHRLSPHSQHLKALFDDGEFGAVLMGRFDNIAGIRPKRSMHRRSMNNGPVLDMTPHFTDLMRFLTGCEAKRVTATGHIFGADKPGLADIEDLAIDSAEMLVEFDGGHSLSMRVAWGLPDGFGMRAGQWLVGPHGYAQLVGKQMVIKTSGREEHLDPRTSGSECVDNLAEAIQGREKISATGKDALESLRVSLAALESIKTGQPVSIDSI